MQSLTHAHKCLDLMEHRLVGKNEVTYTELLKVCKVKRAFIIFHIPIFLHIIECHFVYVVVNIPRFISIISLLNVEDWYDIIVLGS